MSGRRVAGAAACLAAAALVLLPISPAFQPVPGRDAGAFLYVARTILDGGRPYVDVWDHKGPVLYLFNVVGLALPLPGLWGVFAVRVALLGAGAWSAWRALRHTFGAGPAALAVAGVLAHVAVFVEDGNFTEEYAVGLGLLALAAFARGRLLLVGVCGAACFLMRQNLVVSCGVLALVAAAEALRERGPGAAGRRVLAACAGGAAVLVPVLVWLACNGALGAWWEASFTYNRVYASGGAAGHLVETLRRVVSGPTAAIVLVLAAGWAAAVGAGGSLALFAIVAFPLEVVASSLSGNAYLHYYLPWLVPGAVLLAALAAKWRGAATLPPRALAAAAVPVFLLAGIAAWSWLGLFSSTGTLPRPNAAVRFLGERTQTSDRVWIWGAEAGVLVAAGRRSPGPYLYAYPLLRVGYDAHRDVPGFVAALDRDPPRVIVDTSMTNPYVPPLDSSRRASWRSADPGYAAGADLAPLFAWVEKRYRPDVAIGDASPWLVYRLREP